VSPLSYAWLIPLLPALAFVINILFGYRLGKRAAWLSVVLLALATLLAVALLVQVRQAAPVWDAAGLLRMAEVETRIAVVQGQAAARMELAALEAELATLAAAALVREAAPDFPFVSELAWLSIGGQEGIPFGFLLDPLAAMLVLMVALVSLLIHLFSIGYMAGETRFPTFFAYLSLFSAAMLAMVMSRNLFHILLFWELMGVMSYLLIGFYYKKIAAQQAMKKAFLVTKLADLGLLIGIFWLYRHFGTLDLVRLTELAPSLLAGAGGVATAIGLLLFVGAMGKSAQFPLHVWLLDAMEGPTPVSAMIHAATMVAAGVYLIARATPILVMGEALPVIAWVGGLTALLAAILALAFTDVKKILAWSTASQLGLMFVGLGVFGWAAAVFHLVTHAFFKALLFLGAGSMIHGSGTQDIFEMDRLKRAMPATRATFIIGALSLIGVVPFAGFWSKDKILLALKDALGTGYGFELLLVLAYLAVFLTALYTTRLYLLAFEQPSRPSPWRAAAWHQGGLAELNLSAKEVEHDKKFNHSQPHPPHESGWQMLTPLWLLALGATVLGLLGSPLLGNPLQTFVYYGDKPYLAPLSKQWLGFVLGTVVALAGITVAWLLYGSEKLSLRAPAPLTRLLQRLYLDQLYYRLLADPATRLAQPLAWFDLKVLDHYVDLLAQVAGTRLAQPLAWFDLKVLDRLVDLLAHAVAVLGAALRRLQTGRLDHYAWTIAAAALALMVTLSLGGSW